MEGVQPDNVISLLQAYHSNENDNAFNKTDIINHINRRVEAGELGAWSVGLVNNSKELYCLLLEFGFKHNFGLTTRSRLRGRESIGELVQPIHLCYGSSGRFE